MRPRRATLAAAIGLVLALATVPQAAATYDPLGSGATTLRFDPSFLALLKRNGRPASAVAPAKLRGGTASLPVSGGKFDSTGARGAIEHDGALVFSAGRRSVPLRSLQLKTTQRRAPLGQGGEGS